MLCVTVKEGIECTFMGKKGCTFNGGGCHPIVEKCQGCERTAEYNRGVYCLKFPDPSIKWRRGDCNMATHMKALERNNEAKVRIGQQKQKKKK